MGMRPRQITAVSSLVLTLWSIVLSATSAVAEDEEPPSSTITVPYLGEVELPAAEGWTLVCDPEIVVPAGVDVSCTSDGVTFRASTYDAEWGDHEIVVRQVTGTRFLDARYRVALAPPAPPVVTPTVWRSPADAGSTLLVPLSDLGLTCTACESGSVDIVSVEPEDGAQVGTNGSHLVVRPASDFRGMLVVTVGVADQFGQSTPVPVGVAVRAPLGTVAGALHVARNIPAGAPSDHPVVELVWAADPDDLAGARTISCGPALRGSVSCDSSTVRYDPPLLEPNADGNVVDGITDQFSVRIVTRTGIELSASVTVTTVVDIAEPSRPVPVPASLGRSAALLLTPAIPAENRATGIGLLTPLSSILDRISTPTVLGGTP